MSAEAIGRYLRWAVPIGFVVLIALVIFGVGDYLQRERAARRAVEACEYMGGVTVRAYSDRDAIRCVVEGRVVTPEALP